MSSGGIGGLSIRNVFVPEKEFKTALCITGVTVVFLGFFGIFLHSLSQHELTL